MRSILNLALLASLWAAGAAARAEPLPAGDLLQKLSLKLRGSVPTAQETADFKAEVAAAPDQFSVIYDAKVADYLSSRAFRDVAESIHAVWWRLPKEETTAFVAYLIDQDRPYWEIFDRRYILLDGSTAGSYRSAQIGVESPLPTVSGDWRVVRLAESETRFRSVLSDLDLLNRFPDTATNRNRARSNYIFRTFLCENLTPSEPIRSDDPPLGNDDPHGTDPDCVGCHYRLDPLARFFDHWRPPLPNTAGTWFDVGQTALGKLIVRDEGAPTRIYEGASETELARILNGEPKVHACVVKRAWEAMVGLSVKMPDDAKARLLQAFDQRSSYKDLIAEVVRHPYFWSTEEAPSLRFGDIKINFSGCSGSSCHNTSGPTNPKFDPTQYPFLADPAENAVLLKRIWGALNHTSGFKAMPKAPRPKLPSDSLQQIRDWLTASALDDAGNPTLTDAQLREVLDE